ncbi:hypothetical protein P3L51_07110 [Streptomyces sp. PSRA5]|uniref:hypothetical protein n=1 Tax=Streptomyces panacea TaxID=3035064 RepID=UPI00339BD0EE
MVAAERIASGAGFEKGRIPEVGGPPPPAAASKPHGVIRNAPAHRSPVHGADAHHPTSRVPRELRPDAR